MVDSALHSRVMSAKACNKCGGRHGSPRGKKCNFAAADTAEAASNVDAIEIILARLTAMEQRLSALEAGKSTAPTSDSDDEEEELPTANNLTCLRWNATLQKQVHQRLKALGIDDSDYDDEEEHKGMCRKKRAKSGRVKTASDFIKIEVEWPHYHVYRGGGGRKPAAYDELTVEEFVHGYLATVLEGKLSSSVQQLMLQHLRYLMWDAAEFSFDAARSCHSIVLQHLEQRRLTWADQDKLQELHHTDICATTIR